MQAKVFSGKGIATKIMQDYVEIFKSVFGISVFPGTLNLEFEKEIDTSNWNFIYGFKKLDGTKRGGIFYRKGKLEKFDVFFIRPELTNHRKNILEVVSDINIRKILKVKDRDTVVVSV